MSRRLWLVVVVWRFHTPRSTCVMRPLFFLYQESSDAVLKCPNISDIVLPVVSVQNHLIYLFDGVLVVDVHSFGDLYIIVPKNA